MAAPAWTTTSSSHEGGSAVAPPLTARAAGGRSPRGRRPLRHRSSGRSRRRTGPRRRTAPACRHRRTGRRRRRAGRSTPEAPRGPRGRPCGPPRPGRPDRRRGQSTRWRGRHRRPRRPDPPARSGRAHDGTALLAGRPRPARADSTCRSSPGVTRAREISSSSTTRTPPSPTAPMANSGWKGRPSLRTTMTSRGASSGACHLGGHRDATTAGAPRPRRPRFRGGPTAPPAAGRRRHDPDTAPSWRHHVRCSLVHRADLPSACSP